MTDDQVTRIVAAILTVPVLQRSSEKLPGAAKAYLEMLAHLRSPAVAAELREPGRASS